MPFASIEDVLAAAGVTARSLSDEQIGALDRDGYVVLRGAIPPDWIAPLRERFEAMVRPSEEWPIPREHGTRHSMLQNDEWTWRVCLLPAVLAGAYHLIKRRFFLAAVQGRDPCKGGGYQNLHRDWDAADPTTTVTVLAFLDPYGPGNGATRVVPGTHLTTEPAPNEHPDETVLEGQAGDILLFDAHLIHSSTRNPGKAMRRTLQMAYYGYEMRAQKREVHDVSRASEVVRYFLGE